MMDVRLRQSYPARLAALGFIVLIIFGNFWVVQVLCGAKPGVWIGVGFSCGLAGAALGGIGLAYLRLRLWLNPDDELSSSAAEANADASEATGSLPKT